MSLADPQISVSLQGEGGVEYMGATISALAGSHLSQPAHRLVFHLLIVTADGDDNSGLSEPACIMTDAPVSRQVD
jgi:hypothetical protein